MVLLLAKYFFSITKDSSEKKISNTSKYGFMLESQNEKISKTIHYYHGR
jgi:hypothetical protein